MNALRTCGRHCRKFAALGLALHIVGGVAAIRGAQADVVVVVSAKSPISTLTEAQATAIFLGKVRTFPNGLPAVPIDQAAGASARDEFYAKHADKTAAQMRAYWSKIIFTGRGEPPQSVANGVAMKHRIAADTAAIGYLDAKQLDATVRALN